MISKGGGLNPRWRNDGRELYFNGIGISQQMAVEISTDKTFQAGTPRRLFPLVGTYTAPDVAPDGKRFLMAAPEGSNTQTPMTVVLNWQAGLKK